MVREAEIMNTMAHLAALVALMWGAIDYAEGTLGETPLSVAFLILWLMWLPLTYRAIVDDINDFRSRRGQ